MRYLVCNNKKPLVHVSSGQLLNKEAFIHPKRKIDTWVIIICTKGILYITQDERSYQLTENQYIILFAGHEHYGFKESSGELSYYWCHFQINGSHRIVKKEDLIRIFDAKHTVSFTYPRDELKTGIDMGKHFSGYYILPEYGDISSNGRAVLIFRLLLDLARKDRYSDMLPNYSLSLLAMEITQEFIETYSKKSKRELKPKIERIIEWIRVNYARRYSMDDIARNFSYNADYLSTAFRRYTGIPLKKYIRIVQIDHAKILLLNSTDSIKEVAFKVGFEDEKLFMKQFKQIVDITPTTFRHAFSHTKIVK